LKPSTIIVVALDYLDPQVGEISNSAISQDILAHRTARLDWWIHMPLLNSNSVLPRSRATWRSANRMFLFFFFAGNSEI
jgi:hypothetical protein